MPLQSPPPAYPLYMRIDEAYRDWWENPLRHPPIPSDCTVVRVNNAIQGHPESPRLWEKLIDKILKDIGLHPTTHEPCLYQGTINGKLVLFLRQVDDFAIATHDEDTANYIIAAISKHLQLPIHNLGIITRFNGINVDQTKHYVKLHCTKYLTKMLQHHPWALTEGTHPIPFPSDKTALAKILNCPIPTTDLEKKQLESNMGIKYHHVMGEVMYPMVKCRPDISTHAIILSQFMNNPGEAHYIALKELVKYLAATISEGIHYWRENPNLSLQEGSTPNLYPDNYTLKETRRANSKHLIAFVDSDWATNTKKRNSMTGLILMYAGGAVGYKSKFQTVIAHSSTEAEFVAACDTAKMILFFRSLLQDAGLEQTDATVMFEDNNGALLMANAQQPTKRTQHIDIKHFALLDWVEGDLVILHAISTHDNAADAMTKTLTKPLFH
jgi:hypothetical protein